jgi:hypothetical protein
LIQKNIVSQHKVLIYFKQYQSLISSVTILVPDIVLSRNPKCSEEHFITLLLSMEAALTVRRCFDLVPSSPQLAIYQHLDMHGGSRLSIPALPVP